eukprot:2176394-Amphidinium_carterae.1
MEFNSPGRTPSVSSAKQRQAAVLFPKTAVMVQGQWMPEKTFCSELTSRTFCWDSCSNTTSEAANGVPHDVFSLQARI